MTRHRNIQFERDVTYDAGRGVVDAGPLIEFSETRARGLSDEYVRDHMLVALDRDRVRDAKEELSDCRNHLVWWLEDNLEDERIAEVQFALRHVLLAYDLLCR